MVHKISVLAAALAAVVLILAASPAARAEAPAAAPTAPAEKPAADTAKDKPAEVAKDAPAEAGPRARPTPEQVAWHDMELEMFIHFGPAVWQGVQYDNLSAPLSAINPEKLDTEQWADVAVAMGARQIVFVAKHDGGFCWWQTETTDYGVKNTPWRGGKGDVMKDLAASRRNAATSASSVSSRANNHLMLKSACICHGVP